VEAVRAHDSSQVWTSRSNAESESRHFQQRNSDVAVLLEEQVERARNLQNHPAQVLWAVTHAGVAPPENSPARIVASQCLVGKRKRQGPWARHDAPIPQSLHAEAGALRVLQKKAVVLLGTEQACDDHEEDDHHGRKKHVLGAAFVLDDAVEPPVCLRSDDKSSSSPDNNDDPVEPSVLTLEKNAGLAVVLLQFLDNDVEEEGDTGVPGLAVESKADEEGFVVVVLLPLAFGVEPRRRTKSWGGSVSFLLSFVFFSLLDEYYY